MQKNLNNLAILMGRAVIHKASCRTIILRENIPFVTAKQPQKLLWWKSVCLREHENHVRTTSKS